MGDFIIPFIALLGTMFFSRVLGEKANKFLDHDKKAELVDLFSSQRVWRLGILILIIAIFIGSNYFQFGNLNLNYLLYTVVIVAFITISTISSFKKLKANNFPDGYIKYYLLSTILSMSGVIVFLIFILIGKNF